MKLKLELPWTNPGTPETEALGGGGVGRARDRKSKARAGQVRLLLARNRSLESSEKGQPSGIVGLETAAGVKQVQGGNEPASTS